MPFEMAVPFRSIVNITSKSTLRRFTFNKHHFTPRSMATKAIQPVPAILCGKTFEVGEKVTPLIQPDIEVIHFINSVEDAKSDLGHLIAGRGPKSSSPNHIGSHDYSKPPLAVIFGRAFHPDEVKALNEAHRGQGAGPIAWIAGDPSVVLSGPPGPGYAEKGADNVKRALARWKENGSDSEDIVYY